MSDEKYYAVEVLPKDSSAAVSVTTVPASGPLEAARRALGEVVTNRRQADDVRVRVWELRDDFTTNCLELFKPAENAPDLTGTRRGADSMNVHNWIALVCVLAVAATSLVVVLSRAMPH